MKPAGALRVEVAATGIYISRGGHGPHLTGRGVTGHAGSLYTVLDGAKEREGKDRAPCHPCGSQAPGHHNPDVGLPSSSVSFPLSQPRWTSGRARCWGQERDCSTPTSLTWPPLPPASFLRSYGCGGGVWARALAPYDPCRGVKLSPNACHPNHNLASHSSRFGSLGYKHL